MRKKLLSTLMLLAATTGVANAAGEFAFAVENDYTFYFRPISDTEVAIIHPSEYDPNLGPYVGSFAWDMPETVTYDGVTYTVTTVAEGAFRNATVCGSNQYTNMFWFPGSITTYEADAFDNWTCNIVGMYGTTIDSKAFRNNNINRFRCFVTGYSSSEDNDHGSYNGNDMGGDVYKTVDGRTILVGWGGDHRVNAWVKHITGAAANRNITTEWTFNYDEIGDYALYGNSNLTTVTIAGATRIGVEAMKNMTALTTLTLPATLTEIDTDAFAGATAISTITCNATTPPTGAVFDETVYERIRESGNITVPEEALAAYQADENWGQFWASAPAPTTYTVSVLATENGTVVADKAAAAIGETVTLTVTPAEGYELESITVTAGYEVQGGSGGGRAP
ncbi:MAG: leucine-rich repeat protein, partial [Muribaculaceae bacterium]|nr:leucine-rich repeat protein [Muribaculaceae bacterium]